MFEKNSFFEDFLFSFRKTPNCSKLVIDLTTVRSEIPQYTANVFIEGHALQSSDLILFREKYQTEQRLANRTIRSIESCLKGALKDAVHLDYINKTPLEHFKILRLGLNDKKEIQVFEKEEQDVLLRSAQSYSEKLKDPRWFIRIYCPTNRDARR